MCMEQYPDDCFCGVKLADCKMNNICLTALSKNEEVNARINSFYNIDLVQAMHSLSPRRSKELYALS